MMNRKLRANAERIVQLADAFGRLPINEFGQTVEGCLNLSIPCARLVKLGVVTGVADTFDGINEDALTYVETYCKVAVELATEQYGRGWWTERADELLFATPERKLP